MSSTKKTLGLFGIIMINVIAVDSIRTLPIAAKLGPFLIFIYLLGGLFFLIPSALVSAELGTGWPNTGGIYVWVREAFGKKAALVVIWLNWMYNVVWYPTIMALIAGTLTYLFNPALADNKIYMTTSILVLFWAATFANFYGMRISSAISTVGAIVGTLLPMILIASLGLYWLTRGYPLQIAFTPESLVTPASGWSDLGFFSSVLFGLLGLEMAATHAAEMRNPSSDYPKSLWISVLLILGTIVTASLAIALVVPQQKLNLFVGALQAFDYFFTALGIPRMTSVIALCIILGGMSAVSAWVIGPTKGILMASRDKSLPAIFAKTNRHNVPVNILLLQGGLFTVLSLFYLFLPSVNSSFWILNLITAQLALIVYVFLFASAIKLAYSKPHIKRSYRIPGGIVGVWIVSMMGISVSVFAFIVGFIPPKSVVDIPLWLYELLIMGGMALLALFPLLLYKRYRKALIS